MDPESQRDAMEELARSIRVRRTDAEPSSSVAAAAAAPSRAGDSQAASASPASAMVAAAALGMPHYGGSAGRLRGSAASGQPPAGAVGLAEGRARSGGGADPWFSLRGHQAGRMVMGSAGGMGGGGGGAAGLGLTGRR